MSPKPEYGAINRDTTQSGIALALPHCEESPLVNIGIKLDLGFSAAPAWRELLGDADVAEALKALGVRAAETPLGPETDMQGVLDHARRCRDAGLRLSLHPYSERTAANPAHFERRDDNLCLLMHKQVLELAATLARKQRQRLVVNMHPAAARAAPGDRSELLERSVAFFAWCREICAGLDGDVHPVAELQIAPNPDEQLLRIGDRFDELEQIVQRSGVDACWDFGHGILNARRYGGPDRPDRELLARISHVHCHDVHHHDHEPLRYGTVPWHDYLLMLYAHGFDGTVILEVPAEQFIARGGRDDLERSIGALQAWIAQRGG
ncbi:MAG: TIM barrel protein [Chitinivibrionales bacterium]|nr:TIM barrel protein [Chitinivibrionales bacterium]